MPLRSRQPATIWYCGHGVGHAPSDEGGHGHSRHALTAAHVLADTESVLVRLAGGEWHSARMVRSQEHFDVALLEIEGEAG
ncbi:trypsin-like peptidase domain-containing protein [Zestomonas thermotolerans]|uniref:trypsin-like peptidase domain-containing protein n=1 Tax=Zestomonas thermotolerans TaxID=157784 RepID=UPI003B587200